MYVLMVLILVFLTLALSITVEVIRRRWKRASEQAQLSKAPVPKATRAPQRLLHPGHSWVRVMNSRRAVVGVDDLAQSFIGRVERVDTPKVGRSVRQGEPLVTLRRGRRAITVVSPLSGVFRVVNDRLASEPAVVNESPYENGWIAEIDPENLQVESRNLLGGTLAERWREGVLAQMRSRFAPRLGMVLQDGGRWSANLGEALGDEAWESLAQELFPLHSSGSSETNQAKE